MVKSVKEKILNSKSIGIFTGAGISTNSGIRDFRSVGGLYSYAKEKYNLPYPEAIFDIEYFKSDPKPFFDLSKEMLSKNIEPTVAHKKIAYLENIGKIKIVVTQNIDMLHEKAGSNNVVNCHGTYKTATCQTCRKKYQLNEYLEKLQSGEIPYCDCKGVIKPDVTFFGETLPKEFYEILENPPKLDLLITIGSSLQVEPAASFVKYYFKKVPTVLINRDSTPYDKYFDYILNMDIDDFFKEI